VDATDPVFDKMVTTATLLLVVARRTSLSDLISCISNLAGLAMARRQRRVWCAVAARISHAL